LKLNLEDGKAISDYRHWDYRMTHPTSGIVERLLDVNFNSDRTALVTIRCIAYDDFYGRCPSIAGVIDGSTEQDVIQRLGPPDSTEIKSGIKVLTYRTLGIGLRLRKERVYLLSITDANLPKLNRRHCKARGRARLRSTLSAKITHGWTPWTDGGSPPGRKEQHVSDEG